MDYSVKRFMTRKIKSVSPEMNAHEALKMLVKAKTSGLPVLDKEGRLAGVFTEKEVLRAILPGYLHDVGMFAYGADSKSELRKLARLARVKVRDIMRTEVPTLDEGAPLTEASHIMLTRGERRIVVLKKGVPVGVITRADVVKALSKEAGVAL